MDIQGPIRIKHCPNRPGYHWIQAYDKVEAWRDIGAYGPSGLMFFTSSPSVNVVKIWLRIAARVRPEEAKSWPQAIRNLGGVDDE
jgi:hypothetical protein